MKSIAGHSVSCKKVKGDNDKGLEQDRDHRKKKIGIISDTHGLLRPEVLEILKDCKYILHAGDVNKDEILDVLRSMGNLYVVRGNNDKDWAENLRTSLSFTIGGVKFFMVHNKKDVAWELGDIQVVIFGHTHKYFEKMIDGRLWLNPGSCGRSRFGGEVTMAVMTVEDGKYHVEKIIWRKIPGNDHNPVYRSFYADPFL